MAEPSAFDAVMNEILGQLRSEIDEVVALIQRPFTAIGQAALGQTDANSAGFGDGAQAAA